MASTIHPGWALEAPPAHWEEFARTHWESRSFSTTEPFASMPVTAGELFELACRAPASRGSATTANVRFYRDGAAESCDLGRYAPRYADGGFEGFGDRLERAVAGDDYTFVINSVETLDWDLWDRARRFLHGLYREIGGVPNGAVEIDLFFGRYASTPFGIHQDYASNFMFTLLGTKTILLWPPEERDLPRETVHYDEVRDSATELPTTPGTLTYWPSSAWHVLESADGPTLSLHIALHFSRDPLQRVSAAACDVARDRAEGPPLLQPAWSPRAEQEVRSVCDRLAAAMASDATRQRLLEQWMRRTSGFGFAKLPPPLPPVPPAGDAPLHGDGFPILVAETAPGVLSVSANGHLLRMPVTGGVVPLIDDFNRGRTLCVEEILAEHGRGAPAAMRDLVTNLAAWRALAVEGA